MHVNFYEKLWMWAAGLIIVVFLLTIALAGFAQGNHPPSHVETVDPANLAADPRFAQPGVTANANGGVTVTALALTFGFAPNEIRVPAGRPVTFRLTSRDVVHGFQVVGTNANTMVVPGYVSQLTTTFHTPGEYLLICNEYCGTGHHIMFGTLIVEEAP